MTEWVCTISQPRNWCDDGQGINCCYPHQDPSLGPCSISHPRCPLTPAVTNLLSISVTLLFQDCYVNGIMQRITNLSGFFFFLIPILLWFFCSQRICSLSMRVCARHHHFKTQLWDLTGGPVVKHPAMILARGTRVPQAVEHLSACTATRGPVSSSEDIGCRDQDLPQPNKWIKNKKSQLPLAVSQQFSVWELSACPLFLRRDPRSSGLRCFCPELMSLGCWHAARTSRPPLFDTWLCLLQMTAV